MLVSPGTGTGYDVQQTRTHDYLTMVRTGVGDRSHKTTAVPLPQQPYAAVISDTGPQKKTYQVPGRRQALNRARQAENSNNP